MAMHDEDYWYERAKELEQMLVDAEKALEKARARVDELARELDDAKAYEPQPLPAWDHSNMLTWKP